MSSFTIVTVTRLVEYVIIPHAGYVGRGYAYHVSCHEEGINALLRSILRYALFVVVTTVVITLWR